VTVSLIVVVKKYFRMTFMYLFIYIEYCVLLHPRTVECMLIIVFKDLEKSSDGLLYTQNRNSLPGGSEKNH